MSDISISAITETELLCGVEKSLVQINYDKLLKNSLSELMFCPEIPE
ncbi:MAG: type II toxin-antitoxin system VapC family toxin [Gammaproteobacteria bacterium]|nr:type II toxin-antitoxin system VapC family toxin [Gammaproteobacteria bacterium]